jgi:hypothetical protein
MSAHHPTRPSTAMRLIAHSFRDRLYSKCPSGRFASHLNQLGGLERLELCVILSAAPLCEVPMWTMKNRPRYDRDKLRYPSDLTDEE